MKLKAYKKKELAVAYAPNITERAALNRLNLWIHDNDYLVRRLEETRYNPYQKVFTLRQVALLFEYLGEP